MPPPPTPWYDERPRVEGNVEVTDATYMGNGDWIINNSAQVSVSNGAFGSEISVVAIPLSGNTGNLGSAGIAHIVSSSDVQKAGTNIGVSVSDGGNQLDLDCSAMYSSPDSHIIVLLTNSSGFLARIFCFYATEDYPDLVSLSVPQPLYAYREEEAVQPISIENNVAGWEIYSPYHPTRIVGFNLPTNLKYTDGDSVEHDFTADGGEYGIEFTTPDVATRITIFDESFWLYLVSRS